MKEHVWVTTHSFPDRYFQICQDCGLMRSRILKDDPPEALAGTYYYNDENGGESCEERIMRKALK